MFKKFFIGEARFLMETNDYRVLNRLRNYKLSDIEVSDNYIEFSVPLKSAVEVEKITKCKAKYNLNFFRALNVFYSRPFLSIAAMVCLIMFVFLNNFIFRIKVVGAEVTQQQQIEKFINIKPLTFKSSTKAHTVAIGIAANFDFVAHASSKIIGNTLYFKIYCVDLPGDKNNNGDIVAMQDGVVTNIVVASGRAIVKSGDAVRKGQTLIKGEYQIGITENGEAKFAPCRAVGEVLADVSYSEYGMNMTFDELLGKVIARTGIKQFDKVQSFVPIKDVLEVVATVNKSIV